MKKTILFTLLALMFLPVVVVLVCYAVVAYEARGVIYDSVDDVVATEYGLLLGTTPQARMGGCNYFFTYRIDAAEALFKAKKIERILISGDDDSLGGVDETVCMRDSLVARGVPSDVIVLDGKGLSTIDSVVRANELYGCESVTVISQRFHNERALYLASHLGLDFMKLQAYNARSPYSMWAYVTYYREFLARVKMFIDIVRVRLQ